MNIVLAINKPVSFTPNQMIEKVRQKFPHFVQEKIGFAGRLDPMARGVLLLLLGDANFDREKYLNLNKTYQFTAILGLETDSYDLLGILNSLGYQQPLKNYQSIVDQFIAESIGKKTQPYPPFSTKPVQGKELFKWAREGKLNQIEIPTKEIEIYDFKLLTESTITASELEKIIEQKVSKVEGFFRQEDILKKWNQFFKQLPLPANGERVEVREEITYSQKSKVIEFPTITFEVHCSSGTYVRSLVHNLGKKLGCGAVTLDIYRTKVGKYTTKDCLQLDMSSPLPLKEEG